MHRLIKRLSNRDARQFNESHLKVAFASLLSTTDAWLVRSEPEYERQYVDLGCIHLPQFREYWNFAFELKHLKKKDAAQLESVHTQARQQMERYLATEDLQQLPQLAAYVIVVIGSQIQLVEQVH